MTQAQKDTDIGGDDARLTKAWCNALDRRDHVAMDLRLRRHELKNCLNRYAEAVREERAIWDKVKEIRNPRRFR